ncbi:helix-turn-helix domain-containing protein, partial [Sutterella sp. KLE1602]|uniref:helix-turn-helix domain-containing protein n=1 Tax=Sutterella sp. KLE1602 TaxID=1574262 RepID=UPI001E36BBC9
MIRAIRVRLYPTPDHKKYLAGLFGAVRFCFNKALYLILQRRLPMQDGVNSCASANTRR